MRARVRSRAVLQEATGLVHAARMATWLCVTQVGLLIIPLAAADAQTIKPINATQDGGAVRWNWAWSPLAPIAELPRTLLGDVTADPSLLTRPAPRVGLFWTAGSTGALTSELHDSRAEFQVGLADATGGYHRPLDPGSATHSLASGHAWGRLGERGAGIGRVVADRGSFAEGVFSDVLQPYTTEPYAVLDTLGEATSGTRVLLEGAGGWQLSRAAFGIGVGYSSGEVRTIESAVPRIHTTATPGVTAGVNYELVQRKLRLGVFTRWQQTAESIQIYSVAAPSRVYELTGYDEPVAIDLTSTWFSKRFERSAWAHGAAVGGDIAGVSWTVYTQRERLSAANFNTTSGDAEQDRWDSEGWSAGATGQAKLRDSRVQVTLGARYSTLRGEAKHHDVEGVPFAADESRLAVSADVRLLPGGSWEAAANVSATRDERRRSDGLAEVFSDLRTWRPAATLEIARWLGNRLAISLGGAMAEHNPSGSVPLATLMRPAYRDWIAPELALEATEAHARAGALTLLWQARTTTAFWVRGRCQSVSPAERGAGSLPNQPSGKRTGCTAAIGLVLGGR